jgi:hypothetical protein
VERRPISRRSTSTSKPAPSSSRRSVASLGNRAHSIAVADGNGRASQWLVDPVGVARLEPEGPVRAQHAVQLREGLRPIEQVDDELRDRRVERAVGEGQLLRQAANEAHAHRDDLPCRGEHPPTRRAQ